MPQLESFFSSVPFFNGFPEAVLGSIRSVSVLKNFNDGETVASVGETLNFLAFVVIGRLQVHEVSEDGRVISIDTLYPGSAIGWLQLIDGLPLTCSINAVESTTLLLLPMQFAQKLALTSPLFIERLLKLLAASIRHAHTERAMLSLPNAFHRVIVHINQLSAESKTADSHEQTLQHLPKQHEIAGLVNTSRETVSRALQLLVKNGILAKSGHNIVIKRADLLNQLATEGPEAIQRINKT